MALEDYVEVFPSHFEGPCGKGMCGRPSSDRLRAPLQPGLASGGHRRGFVRLIGSELPARPLNMDAIIATNRGEKDAFWAMPQGAAAIAEITAAGRPLGPETHAALVIDVPTAWPRAAICPAPAPSPQCRLADELAGLPRDRDLLMVCRSGARSLRAPNSSCRRASSG
ncbi:MAG: hypothetical protein U0531_18475 [Dehalococcoidia bacterium]